MKKYKLIKEYPGSPKLGTEIKYSGNGWRCNKTDFAFFDNPANYFEFWEEIVEKDYKILKIAIRRSDKHEIRDFIEYSNYYIEATLNCEGNYIHSVKRLSDGEIFTIGDKIMDGSITSMILSNNEFWLFHNGNKPNVKLFDAKKYKKPLFTTEDGVNIFEGDVVWHLPGLGGIPYSLKIECNQKGYKYFSTKEAAEEYILMNKPCLSVNDIIEILRWENPKLKLTATEMLKDYIKK